MNRTGRLLLMGSLAASLLSGCFGVEAPKVADPSRKLASFSHSGRETSCSICHERNRPAGVIPGSVGTQAMHGNGADCSSCHVINQAWATPSVFAHSPLPVACVSCHEKGRPTVTRLPLSNVVQGHFSPQDCSGCHRIPATAWVFSFTHQDSTGTVLKTCLPCHEQERKNVLHFPGQDCSACHVDPGKTWLGSSASPHPANSPMPASCAGCHESARPADTQYPAPGALVAGHFSGQDCVSCHQTKTVNVTTFSFAHAANGKTFLSCLPCHEARRPSTLVNGFSHAVSGTGDCAKCHKQPGVSWAGALYSHSPAPSTCNTCHLSELPQSVINKMSHQYPGIGDCVKCHTQPGVAWTGGVFTHTPTPASCNPCHDPQRPANVVSGFSHTQYGTADCASCHSRPGVAWSGGIFPHTPAPSECASCHSSRAPATIVNEMSHAFAGIGDCAGCHKQPGTTWAGALFSHAPALTSCNGCHAPQRPVTPVNSFDHSTFQGSQDCVGCHKQNVGNSWTGAVVSHSQFTSTVDCASCHVSGGSFLNIATSPIKNTASAAGFQAATATRASHQMIHTGINFSSSDCDSCHSISSAWGGSWSLSTASPLGTANHGLIPANATCRSCHANPITSVAIVQAATSPATATSLARNSAIGTAFNHSGNMGTNDCKVCHLGMPGLNTGWSGGVFPHASNLATCTGCHDPYLGHPTITAECTSCHTAVVPGASFGMPTNVDHSSYTTAASCTGCHLSGTNFLSVSSSTVKTTTAATGFSAATATQASHQMIHSVVSYSSNDCDSCHSVRTAWGTSWKTATLAPLGSANHALIPSSTACNSCHSTPLTSTVTVKAAATPTAATSIARNTAIGTSFNHTGNLGTNDCKVCHLGTPGLSTGWSGAAYPHPSNLVSCTGCHDPYIGHPATTTECTACHTGKVPGTSFGSPTNVDHSTITSATTCTGCHLSGTSFLSVNSSTVKTTTAAAGFVAATATTASHQMVHSVVSYSNNDCDSCHSVRTAWGTSWKTATLSPMGASNHGLIPSATTCKTCHATAPTTSYTVTGVRIGSTFRHTSQGKHSTYDCSRCHTGAVAAYSWRIATPASNCALCH